MSAIELKTFHHDIFVLPARISPLPILSPALHPKCTKLFNHDTYPIIIYRDFDYLINSWHIIRRGEDIKGGFFLLEIIIVTIPSMFILLCIGSEKNK